MRHVPNDASRAVDEAPHALLSLGIHRAPAAPADRLDLWCLGRGALGLETSA